MKQKLFTVILILLAMLAFVSFYMFIHHLGKDYMMMGIYIGVFILAVIGLFICGLIIKKRKKE